MSACYASHFQFYNYLIINSHIFTIQCKRVGLRVSYTTNIKWLIMDNSCSIEEVFIIPQLVQKLQSQLPCILFSIGSKSNCGM